jgi:hypothetical protein
MDQHRLTGGESRLLERRLVRGDRDHGKEAASAR